MPDFTRPEYASYVDLCRSLRLERGQLQWGGWYCGDDVVIEGRNLGPNVLVYDDVAYGEGAIETKDLKYWLPQLSDWLEMLEAAGAESITIERINHAWFALGFTAEGHGPPPGGVTREEAAARLALAVGAVKEPAKPK